MRLLYLAALLPTFLLLASCEQDDAALAPEAADQLFLVGDETAPYNFGYEIAQEGVLTDGLTTLHQYEFVLLKKDIYRRGYLSGISDMMAINVFSLDGEVSDFNVDLDQESADPDERLHVFGRYCKNMNFSLGTTEEDALIVSGEVSLATNEDGSKTLTLNAAMDDGEKIRGTWKGTLISAKTGY